MRASLVHANRDLLHQIEVVQSAIGGTPTVRELTAFAGHVSQVCAQLRADVLRTLKDLEFDLPDTLPDILDQTQRTTQLFDLINARFAAPIIRHRPEDRLALLVLRWLHDSHAATVSLPFGISDGVFAVYPTDRVPPIYLLPVSRRLTLLYLPLLFHEFGHLLYVCRKREMDDLVADFQRRVGDVLAPATVRQRGAGSSDDSFRQRVMTVWYNWVQEFFCDAVGLAIGGESFLKSFSHYFHLRSTEEYYVPQKDQLMRRHPVTRLRARLLIDKGEQAGLHSVTEQIQQSWNDAAGLMNIREDYEGTWLEELFVPLRRTLDDMLEEAHPETSASQNTVAKFNPVSLTSEAWRRFEQDPGSYGPWERQAIEECLRTA
ncbi:MAG: hypothetical protein KF841_03130 [Phycisphaerae bacterium]|nr:hypothetical protein [Phycisphaerae bacterium]